ncbi:Protein arginine N-methyltransferase 5 [Frankliniella fusca]|uniref:Protein arginine N-methyltransferase n=1 Tax=Frankliniella fusca TaxID=407009 RepID=A0AAE1GRT2_9NEOP|nr:Protein arginine N-methyltransferase 5 [Frankliniella fusca]
MANQENTPGRKASCGLDFVSVLDIRQCLAYAAENKYDFTMMPIVHPRFKREFLSGKAKNRQGPFTRSDLLLQSSDWTNMIVGKISPYIDVDSEDCTYRRQSEELLAQEMTYASHLNLCAITIQLTSINNVNLARRLYSKIVSPYSYQVWLRVPMESPLIQSLEYRKDIPNKEDLLKEKENNPWEWWNIFRSVCNYNRRLGVALEVSADLPATEEIERWLGEPVRCLILPTSLFLTNKKGYPVLSKAHQTLLRKFVPLGVQIVVTGSVVHGSVQYYQQYIDHLWQNVRLSDPLVGFARGYEDFLQCPLQPLMDNLESHTYEVFEKDPVKYTEYQQAMFKAITDRVPEDQADTKTLTVMVVGAGRGPLVRALLNAADKAQRKVNVYAVEKNPNAIVTLLAQKEETWHEKVTVVSCDMRHWEAPEKADIIISELLGSFGDNELSPECLDGAQKFLCDDGISIPSQYTSFLCPIQSSKLYNEVRLSKEQDTHPLKHFETPYVVHQQNRLELSDTQPLFQFDHPNKDIPIDNTRFKKLQFKIRQTGVLHGFAGYFETVLYKDVMLSINPATHSPGMFSWFPIFFPIREPVHVKEGDILEVNFWRVNNSKNVWYEWCISKPCPGPIHNPNGRSYTIGL